MTPCRDRLLYSAGNPASGPLSDGAGRVYNGPNPLNEKHKAMSKRTPKRRAAQEPRTLPLPPPGYQPSKAELEEEIDMPGLSDQEMRETFFRPFRIVREQPDG